MTARTELVEGLIEQYPSVPAEAVVKEDLLRTHALTPDSRPAAVWDEIRIHRSVPQLLLTGHEPLFSALAAHLLGSPSLLVDFKKGALIRIDVDALGPHPRGILKWLLTPRLAAAD